MSLSEARLELDALNADIAQAGDAILFAVQAGLSHAAAARAGDASALDELEPLLCAMLEACAFQDLAGQRIGKIGRLMAGEGLDPAGLENGPQRPGLGVDQAAADALFAAMNPYDSDAA